MTLPLQFDPVSLFFAGASLIGLYTAIQTWRLRPAHGAAAYSLTASFVCIWALGEGTVAAGATLAVKELAVRIAYLGIVGTPLAWLLFACTFADQEKWLAPRRVALLSVVPVVIYGFVLTFPYHTLYYVTYGVKTRDGLVLPVRTYGPLFWLWCTYAYILVLAGDVVAIRAVWRSPALYRGQGGLVIVGSLIPLVTNMFFLAGWNPIAPYDPSSIAFAGSCALVWLGLSQFRFLDFVPVAHHLVFKNVNCGVIAVDAQSRIVDMNPAAGRILKQQGAPPLGMDLCEAFGDDRALLEPYRDVMQANAELTLGSAHYEIQISPLVTGRGEQRGRILVLYDVTSQKRLIEDLNAHSRKLEESRADLAVARDQALAASRAKSTFLANMSHELRTPLNAVIGYGEMLQDDANENGDEEYVPDLQKIVFSGKHLLSLINDILDLSKIEAGKIELFAESLDVAELVEGTAATIHSLVERNANRLEVSLSPDAGAMFSDQTRIRQILFNLLSNASKFTKQGVIRLAVRRERRDGADWLEFSVTDSGIGMTTEQMGKIFEAFGQASASTTRNFGGTGLGLTITKRFCEMLGGGIEVSSEPGRWSCFTVRLPATMPGSEKTEVKSETGGESAALAEGAPPAEWDEGKRSVLVIEDDTSARELLRRALEREGYAVRVAANGKEGLRLARQRRPDVITLDVVMPKMDGWAVLSALKAEPGLSDVPVIVITVVENRDLGFALGAAEYLLKPVERERLIEVLSRLVPSAGDGPVLVVDDEEVVRERIARAVQSAGYRTVEAENGRAALAEMKKQRPQLILLDLLMPEMDGFEFLAALRKTDGWGEIPVVVVTSKDLTAAERASLSGTTERVFQKGTYDAASLVAEVSRLIATRHAA